MGKDSRLCARWTLWAMDDIEARILSNDQIAPGYFLLKAKLSRPMDKAAPGQFVMVRVPDREIFLRRPFSIYDHSRGVVSLMYRVVGKGTGSLSRTKKGAPLSLLCPLGKGFTLRERDAYIVVAGGIGIAGVHALIKRLGKKASPFFGCAGETEVPLVGDLAPFNVQIATLDGSVGFRGNVVQLLARHVKTLKGKDFEVFACGPENMLRSLKKLLEKERVPCQASFEERMACGLGLCFGCVKKTIDEEDPYKRVCKEGPVFDLWHVCL